MFYIINTFFLCRGNLKQEIKQDYIYNDETTTQTGIHMPRKEEASPGSGFSCRILIARTWKSFGTSNLKHFCIIDNMSTICNIRTLSSGGLQILVLNTIFPFKTHEEMKRNEKKRSVVDNGITMMNKLNEETGHG